MLVETNPFIRRSVAARRTFSGTWQTSAGHVWQRESSLSTPESPDSHPHLLRQARHSSEALPELPASRARVRVHLAPSLRQCQGQSCSSSSPSNTHIIDPSGGWKVREHVSCSGRQEGRLGMRLFEGLNQSAFLAFLSVSAFHI